MFRILHCLNYSNIPNELWATQMIRANEGMYQPCTHGARPSNGLYKLNLFCHNGAMLNLYELMEWWWSISEARTAFKNWWKFHFQWARNREGRMKTHFVKTYFQKNLLILNQSGNGLYSTYTVKNAAGLPRQFQLLYCLQEIYSGY